MKHRVKQELRSQKKEALVKECMELKKQLVKLANTRYTKPSKNVREAKTVRGRLAVILSILREQEV